ncbi:MAG TPA: DUF3107 domain-containing protein [Actinomycetota bacterium]|jgi:hypothetical protein|nr:DUF3107 domain-containing protein [Actinomycetota bacterium]
MEIAIGVEFTARELRLETDGSADDVRRQVEEAYSSEQRMLWLTDTKGRQVGVPLSKLTYVELDPGGESKRVGFSLPS